MGIFFFFFYVLEVVEIRPNTTIPHVICKIKIVLVPIDGLLLKPGRNF